MSDKGSDIEARLALAELVLQKAREAMVEAYESGGMSGLCAEGRWELALDSLRSLDLKKIVEGVSPPSKR